MTGKRIKCIVAMGLLVLFAEHFCSVTLFFHTHTIDGRQVTHSHPYQGSPESPQHSHTAIQLETLAHLATLLVVIAALTGLGLPAIRRMVSSDGEAHLSLQSGNRFAYLLRGPPCA